MPSSEKKMIWYRHSDLKRMRLQQHDETTSWWEGPAEDDFNGCLRRLHKLMATNVVLDEQKRQKKEGICDPMIMSQKYREFVFRARCTMFTSNLLKHKENGKKKKQDLGAVILI
jgi:hypothetical protein